MASLVDRLAPPLSPVGLPPAEPVAPVLPRTQSGTPNLSAPPAPPAPGVSPGKAPCGEPPAPPDPPVATRSRLAGAGAPVEPEALSSPALPPAPPGKYCTAAVSNRPAAPPPPPPPAVTRYFCPAETCARPPPAPAKPARL